MSEGGIWRWIHHNADWRPAAPAIACGGLRLSYEGLAGRIDRLAAALAGEFGIKPGDRIAHLGPNGIELVELIFAAARLGAAVVPLNWRLAPPEHAYVLTDCAPRAILADPQFVPALEGLAPGVVPFRRVVLGAPLPGWSSYDEVLAAGGSLAAAGDPDPGATALIVYTSGTTGRPKGAMLSQSALFWNALNAALMQEMSACDHVLTVVPMFHVGGLNIQTLPALYLGAAVTILPRFEPGAVLAAIEAARPSLLVSVPATTRALVEHPAWAGTDLSSLRLVMTGSSIVPEAMLLPWFERGVPVSQVYGMTESGPCAIALPIAEARRKMGSTGRPVAHCRMRIVDAQGRDVETGIPGEILLRGPNLMTGYWNAPTATSDAFVEGWYRTGDIGHVDAEGDVWIDDRKKDLIISGGENIYPAELEAVLLAHPGIADAAVVGRADERWGERAVAFVVRRPDTALGDGDVLAFFEGRLARFKHPSEVRIVDALPRNAMGKIQKDHLRQLVGGHS